MSDAAGLDPGADLLAALPFRLGEIIATSAADGAIDLRHRDDAGRNDLKQHADPEAAVSIARFDEAGKFRALKTAPTLRRGWRLLLPSLSDARLALDFFYPGRVAAILARDRGTLRITPLRETLNRQTGMYRAAARLTDQEADELVAEVCRSEGGCLRTILWPRDASGAPASARLPASKFDPAHDQSGRGEPTLPLLCQEACNLLVAAARGAVKVADK